jgi:hypothetical protein
MEEVLSVNALVTGEEVDALLKDSVRRQTKSSSGPNKRLAAISPSYWPHPEAAALGRPIVRADGEAGAVAPRAWASEARRFCLRALRSGGPTPQGGELAEQELRLV